jgi:aryl-alcohol dehydrogenase-like predicted oxidoreductase
MQTRRLGRTGHHSTLVIMGSAAFYSGNQEETNATMDRVLAAGINHIDVAPGYGLAEKLLGPWLESRRDRFFISCKTEQRTADKAWADLENSFKLLHTDHFELYQFHAVTSMKELDQVTAPGGAWETLARARDEGLTQWLGITGHGMLAPRVHLEALKRLDLDTVMFPLNPRLYADPDFRRDAEALLAYAQEHDVGVMIIKSIARGPWGEREHTYNTWYEPYDTPQPIADGVQFVLSQPGVTSVASVADVRLLPMVIQAGETFQPMDPAAQQALIAARASDGLFFEPVSA